MDRNDDKHVREEYAIVLDFLPNGSPSDPRQRKLPVAQLVGKTKFMLLEAVVRPGVFLQPYEEVYIGDGKRDKVSSITGRLTPDDLTPTAKSELEHVLMEVVKSQEARFVEFFNKAGPLNIRTHSIELLPGFGKKHMWELLERRQDKPFSGFSDIRERTKLIPDPERAIVRRIVSELAGREKHRLFVEG